MTPGVQGIGLADLFLGAVPNLRVLLAVTRAASKQAPNWDPLTFGLLGLPTDFAKVSKDVLVSRLYSRVRPVFRSSACIVGRMGGVLVMGEMDAPQL